MSYVMDGVAYHHELCIAAVHGEGCDWIHYGINEDAPEVFRGLVIPHTEAICRGERRQNFRRANGGVGLKAHTASLCRAGFNQRPITTLTASGCAGFRFAIQ
jgi:hypothetical protein